MNKRLFFTVAVTALLATRSILHADDNLRLETAIYVFRNGDVREITPPAGNPGDEPHGKLWQAPATVRFDRATLTLEGNRFLWNEGTTAPKSMELVADPKVSLPLGRPFSISSAVPLQYLERVADGRLEVRNIPDTSTDAPHCRLTFTVNPARDGTGALALACDLDITTLRAREKIAGVALEVGKPLLDQFRESLKITTRVDQWSAWLMKAPSGSDYSLLLLFKVAPVPPNDAVLAKVGNYHLKEGRFGAAAVAGDAYVYVIGGENRGGMLSDIERLDVRTHEVIRLTNALIPRHHLGAALIGKKIYIFGGQGYGLPSSGPFEEAVEIYDLESGKIGRGAPMPTPRANFGTAVWGQKIYVVGGLFGQDATRRQTNRTSIYDPAMNVWSEGEPMPTIRETKAVVTADGIVAIGGYRLPNVSAGLKTVEGFVPGKNRWYVLPDLDRPVGAHSAAALDETIFVFGDYDPSNEILAYDLRTHTTKVSKNGFTPTSQSTAVTLDGRIYVIGGTQGGGRSWSDLEGIDDIQVFALSPSVDARGRKGD